MPIGICNLSVIPLRGADAHRSEMVSQVLFGEQFEILRHEKEWSHIRMLDTGYEGWLQQGQFLVLEENNVYHEPISDCLVVDKSGAVACWGEKKVLLVPGTKLTKQLMDGRIAAFPYRIKGDFRKPVQQDFETEFPELLDYYRNTPYLWGGRTSMGIDCSGLTQAMMVYFGIQLPRDAYQQAEQGKTVDFLTEIRPGDLAFFDNEEGRITHVGIMIDTETIFHASAYIRIDKMDSEGIFNIEHNRYTHKLRIVKRFLNNDF